MRYAAASLLVLLGCQGHLPAIRQTLAQAGTPCEDVTIGHDSTDGWLLPVRGCDREWQCWFKRPSGKLVCGPDRPRELRIAIAREALHCPAGTLEEGDAPDWKTEIAGCDRVSWCTEMHSDDVTCTAPEDLVIAAKQLSVETGCASESIEQLQFFGTNTQHTYRLNACGAQFSCMVPVVEGSAASRFGTQVTCKPVQPTSTAQ